MDLVVMAQQMTVGGQIALVASLVVTVVNFAWNCGR